MTPTTNTLSTLRKAACLGMGLFLMSALSGCKDSTGEEAESMPPALGVTPLSLDFGTEQEDLVIAVDNRGEGTLDWEVSADASWLSMEPAAGRTDSGDTFQVHVERAALTAGTHEGFLDIRSNGGDEKVLVTLEVVPLLRVAPERLDFGVDGDEIVFQITNDGTGILEWSLEPSSEWLRAVPAAGKTSGEATAVTASIDRAAISPGETETTIEVISSGGAVTIPVIVRKPPGTSLCLAPTGEFKEEAFGEDALWTKRLADRPAMWTFSFAGETTIHRIRVHLAVTAREPSEIVLSVSLRGKSGEILSRGFNRAVASIYPLPLEDTLDFAGTEIRAGDRLILTIQSEPDAWLFMGGDPGKNSCLVLE